MSEKKEQKIVVFLTLTADDNGLIDTGIKLTHIFRKDLCLVYTFSVLKNKNKNQVKLLVDEYLNKLSREMPSLKTMAYLAEENSRELPGVLADDYEAIILIARAADYKRFSGMVIHSPVPFMFVDPGIPVSAFKKIIMPVDIRKECSDIILWCSWFGRFAQSEITGVAANEKRRDSRQLISRNIIFAKKLFLKTGVQYKIFRGIKSSFYNSFETLDFAINSETDLLIILGSSYITPLDWLIGLPERKIIKKASKFPVMLVNPRLDNYILCD